MLLDIFTPATQIIIQLAIVFGVGGLYIYLWAVGDTPEEY